jgi:hypothetical protein
LDLHWLPTKCHLPYFDPAIFCDLLGNKKILFIGDSTMQQTATTVMNYIMWDGNAVNHSRCAKQIIFRAGDTLTGKRYRMIGAGYPDKKRGWWGYNRGWEFGEAVKAEHPDIAVINANAHLSTRKDFEIMLSHVAETYKSLVKQKPFKLVWKTNQPGGCASTPVPSLDAMRTNPEYRDSLKNYNYADFLPRDRFAKRFWQQQKDLPEVHILDLEPLYLRPDAHVGGGDCLHMCVPGPLSIIPRLMLQLLPDLV